MKDLLARPRERSSSGEILGQSDERWENLTAEGGSKEFLQGKQRLLQTSAANDDIPEGIAQRLHCYMELALCGCSRDSLQSCVPENVWGTRMGRRAKLCRKLSDVRLLSSLRAWHWPAGSTGKPSGWTVRSHGPLAEALFFGKSRPTNCNIFQPPLNKPHDCCCSSAT